MNKCIAFFIPTGSQPIQQSTESIRTLILQKPNHPVLQYNWKNLNSIIYNATEPHEHVEPVNYLDIRNKQQYFPQIDMALQI